MKKNLFLISTLVLIVLGCSSIKTTSMSFYSGQISYFDKSVDCYNNEMLMKCKLSDTAIINEYKCISWIWFFENGQIKQFETAADIKLNHFIIPSGSTVFFNEKSPTKIKYIWFSKDMIINNIECKGGGKISTEFYDNDSLKACFLTKDQSIQGFSCRSSLFEPVYFYPNGNIKILTLSTDSKFANSIFKCGESIIVGEDGTVKKFTR